MIKETEEEKGYERTIVRRYEKGSIWQRTEMQNYGNQSPVHDI
jgi:hypothetical protein